MASGSSVELDALSQELTTSPSRENAVLRAKVSIAEDNLRQEKVILLIYWLIYWLIDLFIYLFINVFIYLFIYLFIDPPTSRYSLASQPIEYKFIQFNMQMLCTEINGLNYKN
jgi:hypothetical protein